MSLEGDGFHRRGRFACRHAFTDALANGRPDSDDMAELAKLGSAVVGRIVKMTDFLRLSRSTVTPTRPITARWASMANRRSS